MKTTKANTVEYLILEEGERLKQATLISRSGTGWQGQLFLESIKASNQAWPTGKTDGNGGLILRVPSVDEVIARAKEVVQKAEATLREHGWLVDTATAEELLDHGGGRAGFVVESSNGKADQAGTPLPGSQRPAAAHR